MSSTVANITPSGISGRSLFLTGLVIFLIVALFFIPEIIDFQSTVSREDRKAAVISPESETSEGDDEQSLKKELIESISGEVEKAEKSGLQSIGNILKGDRSKSTDTSEDGKPLLVALNSGVRNAKSSITWDNLKSDPSKRALQKAKAESTSLLKQIGIEKTRTRAALLNFISACGLILEGNASSMSARDAYDYIEGVSIDVTSAMLDENVDRSYYEKWANISMGPAFDASSSTLTKQKYQRVFNPQLTLTSVKMVQRPSRTRRDKPVSISLTGYCVGRDIKKIEVYRDAELVNTLKPGRTDIRGRRTFRVVQSNGNGIFTFLVYGANTDLYEKNYSFYSKSVRFPWQSGQFFLQTSSGVKTDLSLDSYYKLKGKWLTGPDQADSESGFWSNSGMVRF